MSDKETPKNVVVWTEIPAIDMDRAKKFYGTVLDAPITDNHEGPNPMAMLPDVGDGSTGHIYPGKPAGGGSGITPHLAVTDPLGDVMKRVRDAGGEVVSEPISIPFGSFFYAIDTEGNSVGFFKAGG